MGKEGAVMDHAGQITYKGWAITEKKSWSLPWGVPHVLGYEAVGPRGQRLTDFVLSELKRKINNLSK